MKNKEKQMLPKMGRCELMPRRHPLAHPYFPCTVPTLSLKLFALGLALSMTLPVSAATPGDESDLLAPKTEAAFVRGLDYLKLSQNANGSWEDKNNVAITAVALIAYMIQGNFPGDKPYGETIEKGMSFLLNENKNGVNGYMGTSMYEHGLASLALSELWGQTDRDDEIRDALKRAVDVILKAQSPMGGWRYNPDPSDADVSVTAMQLVALASARQAGILVPDVTIEKAIKYVQMCHDPASGGFRYQAFPGEVAFPRSGAAVVCLMMCGRHQDDEVKAGLKYLDDQPAAKFQSMSMYAYAHYYAAVGHYLAGDAAFKKWYPQVRDAILARQQKNGAFATDGSGAYATAMSLIVLGMPYSFVPAYQR